MGHGAGPYDRAVNSVPVSGKRPCCRPHMLLVDIVPAPGTKLFQPVLPHSFDIERYKLYRSFYHIFLIESPILRISRYGELTEQHCRREHCSYSFDIEWH